MGLHERVWERTSSTDIVPDGIEEYGHVTPVALADGVVLVIPDLILIRQ
jgi:hypothetical protein